MRKIALLLLFAFVCFQPIACSQNQKIQAGQEATAKEYYCPMDGYTSDKPGKCPRCGMELSQKGN